MSLPDATRDRITSLIQDHRVLLFMKGNRRSPQCGFSARVIGMLDTLISDYETCDVLSDPEIRDGIKTFSSWPTIPQLYVGGEFIGGCDIVTEMFENGELHGKLGVPVQALKEPTLKISDAAVEALRAAGAGVGGKELHLSVDTKFQNQLYIGQRQAGEVAVQANGLTVLVDRGSCGRADGLSIDVVESADGPGFKLENPNAPNAVRQLTPRELAAKREAREPFHLFDVRTAEEEAQARIEGARLVTQEVAGEIERLDKDAVLVFHCHHGGRSQKAAEHFASLGFRNVYNLAGGIDAWSREIDPNVPRY